MQAKIIANPRCPKHGHEMISTRPRNQVVCPDYDCGYYERIDPLKLYNVITIWDVYVVAESEEAAKACVLGWTKGDELAPSAQTALETREERQVRGEWLNEKPLIAEDISDADFETLKGKSTIDVQVRLYSKKVP